MEDLNITSAQYVVDNISNANAGIVAVIDGETLNVPLDTGNRHYVEILRQVEAGTLTVQAAS